MKKVPFYLSILMLGILMTMLSGCDLESLENCEQDEICAGKFVTACCNDNECYYTYNGKRYGDDAESLNQLAKDLGCTYSALPEYENEIGDIVLRLTALKELARTNIIRE
jgi:hypothetical protein